MKGFYQHCAEKHPCTATCQNSTYSNRIALGIVDGARARDLQRFLER